MSDYIREVRRAVLARMKADTDLTALVPAASIHASTVPANPAWPFIRWDAPQSIPRGVACTQGADVSFMLHCFAKPRESGGAVVETAEDYASRITSAMKKALHRTRFSIEGGTVHLVVRSTRSMMDGDEADAWHGLVNVVARVIGTS